MMRLRKAIAGRGIVACFGLLLFVARNPRAHAEDFAAITTLGRTLFFDRSLSSDGTISCSSCHKPDHAFSDGRRVAVGVGKQSGTRNAPSLLSLSGGPFFWDGRAPTLDALALQPFTNPVEMGLRN